MYSLYDYIYTDCSACSSPKADIVFVIDGSASIQPDNFNKVKSFVQRVVEAFDISNETVRVALIEFSDHAEVQFDLQQHGDKDAVKRAVEAIRYFGARERT